MKLRNRFTLSSLVERETRNTSERRKEREAVRTGVPERVSAGHQVLNTEDDNRGVHQQGKSDRFR